MNHTRPATTRHESPRPGGIILLVEDDHDTRTMTRLMLEFTGHRVITANDGRAGWDAYREYRGIIDIVLLDVKMPRMSGEEVLERIVSEGHPSRPKVIIFSAQQSSDVHRGSPVRTKADGVLPKPFTHHELASIINTMLAWK